MKQISLSTGGRLAVYFSGKPLSRGDVPLVLLHGFCEDATLWSPLLPAWSDMPVVMMDLPGFGASDQPHEPTVAAYADAVEQALDALQIDRCVLLGHSLGGYVALEFAAQHAKRLAGFGLFHSHPYADTDERKTARQRGIEMLQSGKRDLYVSQLFPNLFAPAFMQAHPEVLAAVTEQGKKQSAAGIIAGLQAMVSRRDHQDTLRAARCPVLFVLGETDGLVPLDAGWKSALLPDSAQVVVLPGVAHMGMYEAPETCAERVATFYSFACSSSF